MTKLIEWSKTHKAVIVLLAVVTFLLIKNARNYPIPLLMNQSGSYATTEMAAPPMAVDSYGSAAGSTMGKIAMPSLPYRQSAPPVTAENRLVSKDTNLSLKVDNVSQTIEKIESAATSFGGYLVDSNVSVPEGASSGSITVRVPAAKRAEALSTFKSYSVKVVSEYVQGQDLTDQFVDNEERLRILESTKAKFEAILDKANTANEMLNVQQQLLQLQQQIDSIKGQQKYLEGSASLSRITMYLSTDELSLPYAPVQSWRPQVVFKEAVRSLMINARDVGTLFIWVAVYSPVVIVVAVIAWLLYRRMKNR